MLVAVLLPLCLFVAPLWRITLKAPQYPIPLTMYIWINKLTGSTEGTIQNINIMNHYVGMRHIEPEGFPELTYFPYVVIGLVVLGLIAWFTNNWKIWAIWSGIFLILSVVGIYDFYLWEYDYGHNLSSTAPIKVPGMAYQPPLFGKKVLLNFVAISYPALGGIIMGLSILLGFVSAWLKKKYHIT